jgi:mannose-6-phosphate isomerase-like protein (cupin superfamily)
VTEVSPGVSLTIPAGVHFQFRNTGGGPLRFVLTTMPPWPGDNEAQRVADHWPAGE